MKVFKKLFFITAILISTALFSSCTHKKSIIGTWKVTYITSDDFSRYETEGGITWSFYNFNDRSEHSLNDDVLDGECRIDGMSGIWAINAHRLTIWITDNNYEEIGCDIIELDNKKMSLNVDGTIYEFKKI